MAPGPERTRGLYRFRCPVDSATFSATVDARSGLRFRCPRCGFVGEAEPLEQFTESEWLACGEWSVLWRWFGERATVRKARLFACACFRRLTHLLDERGRKAVEAYELFTEGFVSRQQLVESMPRVRNNFRSFLRPRSREREAAGFVAALMAQPTAREEMQLAVRAGRELAEWVGAWAVAAEEKAQCDLFRDVVGNPFRAAGPRPEWLARNDGAAVKIAHAVYEEGAFADLPVLADALEEAGCDDDEVLSHCRGPGPHVRGCWVVDDLLGRG
jgi:hypothetical protein